MTVPKFGLLDKSQYGKYAYPSLEVYNTIQKKRIQLNKRIAEKKTRIIALATLITRAQAKLARWNEQLTEWEEKDEPLLKDLKIVKKRLNSSETRVTNAKVLDERERIKRKLNL